MRIYVMYITPNALYLFDCKQAVNAFVIEVSK